jgi:hypothetical protein
MKEQSLRITYIGGPVIHSFGPSSLVDRKGASGALNGVIRKRSDL